MPAVCPYRLGNMSSSCPCFLLVDSFFPLIWLEELQHSKAFPKWYEKIFRRCLEGLQEPQGELLRVSPYKSGISFSFLSDQQGNVTLKLKTNKKIKITS